MYVHVHNIIIYQFSQRENYRKHTAERRERERERESERERERAKERERERKRERERERERAKEKEREQTYSSVHEDIHAPSFNLESIKVGVHWSSNDQIIKAAL